MRLTLDTDPRIITIRGYGGGEVQIGEQRLHRACIVSPSRLIESWQVGSLRELTMAQLAPLLALAPRIVLLGIAEVSPRAPSAVRAALESQAIALECLELGAACRTYNVLAQEGRPVVAGLLLEGS